jgi:hypothetical protein
MSRIAYIGGMRDAGGAAHSAPLFSVDRPRFPSARRSVPLRQKMPPPYKRNQNELHPWAAGVPTQPGVEHMELLLSGKLDRYGFVSMRTITRRPLRIHRSP